MKLVKDLKDGMTKRFTYVTELAIECTLLDPRFKKAGFMGDDRKFQKAYDNIQTKLSRSFARDRPEPPAIPQPLQEGPSQAKKSKTWTEFDKLVQTSTGQTNPVSASIVCLDRYLQELPLERHENPLTWWEERKKIYPALYTIAKQRLCIVATSVPCERIFSKTGLITNDRRNRLKAANLSKIIFLNHNL